jgi:hypothetical protein
MMAEWFVRSGDAERGPFSTAKIKELAASGKLAPDMLVRKDDSKWLPAGKVKGLFEASTATEAEPTEASAPAVGATIKNVAEKAGGALAAFSSSVMSLMPAKKEAGDGPPQSLASKVDAQVSMFDRFITEGQDPSVVTKVGEKVQGILTSAESILYIAVQAKPIMNLFPDCVALTTRRFIVYRPKMLGRVDFEDYLWRDLRNVRLEENMIGATIRFQTIDGRSFSMDYIPKEQGRRLYRIAQEHEEEALELQRNRMLEEKRAASGGVYVQTNGTPAPAPAAAPVAEDPMQILQKLKAMADAGLISAAEFDAKKSEILARM